VAATAERFSQGKAVSPAELEAHFRGIRLADLVLARACATGNGRAWEQFFVLYREPLTRAAIAIAGNETVGRDMADALYGELYGLSMREGVRRCPLDSYCGRGSLIGWLRTTLAQRHVDHFRRTRREEPLAEWDAPDPRDGLTSAGEARPELTRAVEEALSERDGEERLMLAAYYLDGRTLAQIAAVLKVHEATVSRRLRRATDDVRKGILRKLQRAGLSRRAAEEALGADPRDMDLNLKKLLQCSQVEPFPEQVMREKADG
jgi:RNA polymerase sigma-70 factor (ECF subfamily)